MLMPEDLPAIRRASRGAGEEHGVARTVLNMLTAGPARVRHLNHDSCSVVAELFRYTQIGGATCVGRCRCLQGRIHQKAHGTPAEEDCLALTSSFNASTGLLSESNQEPHAKQTGNPSYLQKALSASWGRQQGQAHPCTNRLEQGLALQSTELALHSLRRAALHSLPGTST